MNLAADIGNSFTKIGIFKGEKMIDLVRSSILTDDIIDKLVTKHRVERMIVSSVTSDHDHSGSALGRFNLPLFILDSSLPLPFKIEYNTPGTLGADRVAGIAGAHNKFAGNNVLVIDAGTAITYDLLLSNNVYPGGNISPGLNTRFRALHEFTGRLPMVETGITHSDIGYDTESAIRTGVQSGIIFEINEYIRSFKNRHKELKVILTGGDSSFLKDYINFSFIFAPDLVIEGLNHILNYNVKIS